MKFLEKYRSPLLQAVYILLASTLAGLLYNQLSPKGIPLIAPPRQLLYAKDSTNVALLTLPPVNITDQPSDDSSEPLVITLDQAYRIFQSGEAIFLDARKRDDFLAGHIQGALNLPYTEVKNKYGQDLLARIPKDKLVVTYCDGTECDLSVELAYYLTSKGYTQVRIFYGGWIDWQIARYPVEQSDN